MNQRKGRGGGGGHLHRRIDDRFFIFIYFILYSRRKGGLDRWRVIPVGKRQVFAFMFRMAGKRKTNLWRVSKNRLPSFAVMKPINFPRFVCGCSPFLILGGYFSGFL
ncbi:hypothetical protein IE53DRAFT_77562 [Violaceomyces palustris]|uniref:Uncharacterized protein n=1 Tax=Violaceomyces palustris TaxID=1673888 RepID=A0ACD0NYC5_9BASI|nr:hypothetical protein IE53DRAFT_77562 [Violaceomyces palustris]